MKPDQMTEQVTAIVNRIEPLLASIWPPVRGAVLAQLVATWVTGHRLSKGTPAREQELLYEKLLTTHLEEVRQEVRMLLKLRR
jgi:hypothetical protein